MIDMEVKKQLVKQHPCFVNLSDTEITALIELFFERTIPAGTTFVKEGEVADNIYFIVEGEVAVNKMITSGDTSELQTIATMGPGDAIGLKESGFFSTTGLRTATLIAITDVVLLRLNISTFYGFALTYPNVKKGLLDAAEFFFEKSQK